MADLMEHPLALPAAGGLAALLGLLALLRLRRKKAGEAGAATGDDSNLQNDSFFNASGGQQVDTAEAEAGPVSSMMYSPSQLDAAGDVDPVAEADVYLAYGRDLQAEEILKEAARLHPERIAIHHKLLEIYAKRQDKAAMEASASEIYTLTGGHGDDWDNACRVAQPVDPDNPLYRGQAPQGAALAGAAVATAAATAALAEEPTEDTPPAAAAPAGVDLDLDFSELPPETPASETPSFEEPENIPVFEAPNVAQPEPAAPEPEPVAEATPARDDFSVDFDLDLGLDTPAAAPAEAAAEPAPEPRLEDDNGPDSELGFELDLGDAPAQAAEATELSLDDFNAEATQPLKPVEATPRALDLDLDGLSLDLDTPAGEAAGGADADPLETKLSLAAEFQAIGDSEGARALAEEVRDEASGALRERAQAFLSQLS